MSNPNLKWVSAANPSQGDLSPDRDKPSGGGRRIIPFDKIHKMAKESHEGGRGQCWFCKDSFSMNYLRRVKVTAFQTEFACGKCKHERNLQVVK